MEIGQRIKQHRLKLEYTQKQLADKIGLTPKMISFYENGERTPPIDILLKLVQIFGVSADYLLGITDKIYSDEDTEWRLLPVSNRLGNILKTYRRKKNLSETDFSKKLGIGRELYSGIEIGKYEPTLDLLQKIAVETQYDIDYLTGAIDHTSIATSETLELFNQKVPMFIAEGNVHFKSRFEELCIQNSIDQTNVEICLGLDKQAFTDIRWNRMPTLSELLKISYAFGVSLDYLIGKTDIKLSSLKGDELELVLNYRDCLEHFKKSILDRAKDLSLESLREKEATVAAEAPLKKTGTDDLKK